MICESYNQAFAQDMVSRWKTWTPSMKKDQKAGNKMKPKRKGSGAKHVESASDSEDEVVSTGKTPVRSMRTRRPLRMSHSEFADDPSEQSVPSDDSFYESD
jgi:hypothetical protein